MKLKFNQRKIWKIKAVFYVIGSKKTLSKFMNILTIKFKNSLKNFWI
jgi:hypothetical protein